MLGWINKKLKMTSLKMKLGQVGCAGVYPDALLREIVDATFEMTVEMSRSPMSDAAFDFNGNWDWFIQPYLHLLIANSQVGKMRGDMTEAQVAESFTRSGMAGYYTDIHPTTEHHVAQLLGKYGFQNHISAVLPLLSPDD